MTKKNPIDMEKVYTLNGFIDGNLVVLIERLKTQDKSLHLLANQVYDNYVELANEIAKLKKPARKSKALEFEVNHE
jgi:hypothetical protein